LEQPESPPMPEQREPIEAGMRFPEVVFRRGEKGFAAEINLIKTKRRGGFGPYAKFVPQRGAWEPQEEVPYEIEAIRRISDPSREKGGFKGVWICRPVDRARDEKKYGEILQEREKREEAQKTLEDRTETQRMEAEKESKRQQGVVREAMEKVDEFVETDQEFLAAEGKYREFAEHEASKPREPKSHRWITDIPEENFHNGSQYMYPTQRRTYKEGTAICEAEWEGRKGKYQRIVTLWKSKTIESSGQLSPDEMREEGYYPSGVAREENVLLEGEDVIKLAREAKEKHEADSKEWSKKYSELDNELEKIETAAVKRLLEHHNLGDLNVWNKDHIARDIRYKYLKKLFPKR